MRSRSEWPNRVGEVRCAGLSSRNESRTRRIAHDRRGALPSGSARVEVIIRSRNGGNGERYPLRGKPIRYTNPFDSVAEHDWGVLR